MANLVYRFLLSVMFAGVAQSVEIASAEPPQSSEPPIRIGALMPLTGEFAMPAAAFREVIEIAKDLVNSRGGIDGRQLEVLIEDTQSNPKAISSAATKLLNIDHIVAALTTSYPRGKTSAGSALDGFERIDTASQDLSKSSWS